MNPIELISSLPNWKWKANSELELGLADPRLIASSDFIWRVGNVAVVGFMHESFISPPWMWFLLADNVRLADLIDFRRLALMIPKGTLTAVAKDFEVGLRFAKVYDFVEMDEEVVDSGRHYKLMRKI